MCYCDCFAVYPLIFVPSLTLSVTRCVNFPIRKGYSMSHRSNIHIHIDDFCAGMPTGSGPELRGDVWDSNTLKVLGGILVALIPQELNHHYRAAPEGEKSLIWHVHLCFTGCCEASMLPLFHDVNAVLV